MVETNMTLDQPISKLVCIMCNLETVITPVVTTCGHLYCGPCLRKWLQDQQHKHCYKCKSSLMQDTNFIKIYGAEQADCEGNDDKSQCVLECQICLEPPPSSVAVATSCGHIFCWPCLYQWLRHDHRACPVCKNILMINTNVIPIFGTAKIYHGDSDVGSNVDQGNPSTSNVINIPRRPSLPQNISALSSRTYVTNNDTTLQLTWWERSLQRVLFSIFDDTHE